MARYVGCDDKMNVTIFREKMSRLSMLLKFQCVNINGFNVDLNTVIRDDKSNVTLDKKQTILASVDKRGLYVESDFSGVCVNGIYLNCFELGLDKYEGENATLLSALRTGRYCPRNVNHDVGSTIGNANYSSKRYLQYIANLQTYTNLHGMTFPHIENAYGIIDVDFLVSVIATDEQRNIILSKRKECFHIGTDNALTLNGVTFEMHQLWAASTDGKKMWNKKNKDKKPNTRNPKRALRVKVFFLEIGFYAGMCIFYICLFVAVFQISHWFLK